MFVQFVCSVLIKGTKQLLTELCTTLATNLSIGSAIDTWKIGSAIDTWKIGSAIDTWKIGSAIDTWNENMICFFMTCLFVNSRMSADV